MINLDQSLKNSLSSWAVITKEKWKARLTVLAWRANSVITQVNQKVKVYELMWPATTRARRQGPSRVFHLPHPLSPLVTKSCSFYLLFITETHIILFSHYTPALIQIFTCSHWAVLSISHHMLLLGSWWGSMNSTTFSHTGPKQIKLIIIILKKECQTERKTAPLLLGTLFQRLWF